VKRVAWLHEGWELARSAPGTVPDPSALARVRLEWHPAQVPGTVASALRHDPDLPGPFDRDDWWYRVRFAAPERREGVRHRLRFEGLATLAEVWLNGEPLLSSRNMFAPCAADVTDRLHAKNDLAIRFASLESAPPPKRPRARWKSALVSRPGLRALRTTLLGRMPGWTPAVDPVGPWGAVALESIERLDLESLELHATVQGEMPHLRVEARIAPLEGARIEEARVRIEGRAHALAIEEGEIARVHGEIEVPEAPLWWPHTHGAPSLASCRLEVRSGDEWIAFDADRIGFRRIELDEREGGVRFAVNGVPVFCRGACWTPLDILRLRAEPEALRGALVQLRDAGANMLRIPGNTAYESDDFYALCDELGILVWQDFMFANLDYPVADAQFRADVEEEARALLERLHAHPCIAAYCGGSEVAQQAAMLGLPA
jgi:beta-mannosidase